MKRMLLTYLVLPLALFAQAQSQELWADKAYAYVAQDSLRQAEECFAKAIESATTVGQRAMLLANLGTVQRRRGRVHEAVETYTQALALSPMDATLLMHRAIAYMTLGNDDKAYVDLCNVLDKQSANVEALYYRAFIYTNRREYGAARTDYKRLLAIEPDHDNALLGLALLDQREGRLQAAELQLTVLIERYPENASYLQARADILAEQQLFDLALLDLEAAIMLQPGDAHLYVARAELYLKMKRRTAAKADLDRAVALGLPHRALTELYGQCE